MRLPLRDRGFTLQGGYGFASGFLCTLRKPHRGTPLLRCRPGAPPRRTWLKTGPVKAQHSGKKDNRARGPAPTRVRLVRNILAAACAFLAAVLAAERPFQWLVLNLGGQILAAQPEVEYELQSRTPPPFSW